jgi:outer membrane lipoprotein-sorting protein
MDESELLHRLDRVAGVQPSADATERAVARARAGLTSAPTPNRRLRMISRLAALAAAVAALLAVGVWLFSPSTGGLAFADVQEKVKQTKTVKVRYAWDAGKGAAVVITAYFLADGRARLEDPNGGGGYTTIDPKRERSLTVDPAAKQAVLIRGYHYPGPADVYRLMREIRNDEIQRFPPENVDGRTAEVFLAKLKGTADYTPVPDEYRVYVDAKTKLPFRLEGSLPGENGEPGTRVRFDLEFDKALDEKLFSTEPPSGYALRTEGVEKPAAPTADPDKLTPVVIAKEGIGAVKFGMTKKEVIDALGEPDKIDQRGMALDYLSRGYSILVSPQRGVMMIQCYTQATFVVKVKDFAGQTREGVRMGMSAADIVKVYGEPDLKEKDEATTRLGYRRKLGFEFTLFNDKLVQFSLSRVP